MFIKAAVQRPWSSAFHVSTCQKCPSTTWRAAAASGSMRCVHRGSFEWLTITVLLPRGRSLTLRAAARGVRRWAENNGVLWCGPSPWGWSGRESIPLPVHNRRITHISRLNRLLWFICLACGDLVCFCSHALKSWRWVHQGSCHRPQSSNGESQTLTKRRRN